MKEPREHQSRAVSMLRSSLKSGKRRPILKAPVAFGKTLTAAIIIRQALGKGKRVTFVCDAIGLIDQTVRAFFAEELYDVGVIQADHPMENWDRPVQVASVQTLMRRGMPKCDLVIIDECHTGYAWMHDWMRDNLNIPVLGLTATPFAKGMGLHYDDLLVPATMRYLMETVNPSTGRPYMSGYRPFEPHTPDMKGIKTIAGEFHEGQTSEMMSNPGLVADVVHWWQKEGNNEPTLAFCVDRAHARKVQERYQAAGIGWGYVDAHTERADREALKRQLGAKEIYGVASVGTMIKGIDWAIGCISWQSPTKSKIKLVQGDGRGLRDNEDLGIGIGGCIFLDHAGNHSRLGYPEDIDEAFSELCTKAKGEKADSATDEKPVPLPKKCPRCQALRPIGNATCSNCGFEAKPAPSIIEEQEGELREAKRLKPQDMFARDRFYQEALGYARAKGKQDGWAWHLTKRKWGAAPRDKLPPLPPSPEVMQFVRAQNIRYAKGQAKHARS